jgi:hypothetical protein
VSSVRHSFRRRRVRRRPRSHLSVFQQHCRRFRVQRQRQQQQQQQQQQRQQQRQLHDIMTGQPAYFRLRRYRTLAGSPGNLH